MLHFTHAFTIKHDKNKLAKLDCWLNDCTANTQSLKRTIKFHNACFSLFLLFSSFLLSEITWQVSDWKYHSIYSFPFTPFYYYYLLEHHIVPGGGRPRHCRRISTILYCKYTLVITKYNKCVCTGQKSYHDSHFKYCLYNITKRPADQYIDFRGSIFSRCTNFISE